jgi:hypothetical protein
VEGVKKSTGAVIPSEARNLALSSVRKGKKNRARFLASLGMTAHWCFVA